MIANKISSRMLFENNKITQEISIYPTIPIELVELVDWCDNGKLLDVKITKHREKRSLNANSYFWVLVHAIAEKLQTSADEIYLQMLERYGVGVPIIVKPEAVDRVKEEWRTVREIGGGRIGETEAVQLYCYFGSSTYNTKEMSNLIEGVVSECRELDIETKTPQEIKDMLNLMEGAK